MDDDMDDDMDSCQQFLILARNNAGFVVNVFIISWLH